VKFDIPDGFVVIPLRSTGDPVGIALWCETPAQCEEVFNQERGGEGKALLVSCWRSSEVAAEAEPKPAIKAGARHRTEE